MSELSFSMSELFFSMSELCDISHESLLIIQSITEMLENAAHTSD